MLKIALAQYDFELGHISANRDRMLDLIDRARDAEGADLVVFPELALSGYPHDDLLLRRSFMQHTESVFQEIVAAIHGIDVVLPWPRCEGGKRFNSAAWVRAGRVLEIYDKQAPSLRAGFDEHRHFARDDRAVVLELDGVGIGLLIGEHVSMPAPFSAAAQAGADLVISINASAYDLDQGALQRIQTSSGRSGTENHAHELRP